VPNPELPNLKHKKRDQGLTNCCQLQRQKMKTKSKPIVINPKEKKFMTKAKLIIANPKAKTVETKLIVKKLSFNSYLQTS
jgi:hypothetical protein